MARILIACEFSGIVREAFSSLGHDVWSCDLEPTEIPGQHYQGNVRDIINNEWDMMLAFPPCTHLASSGARWFKNKQQEQKEAIAFFKWIYGVDIPKIAVENPIGIMSTHLRKPDQIIQPYQFGHGETKSTCLWLKNLPKLEATCIVSGREPRIHHMPPSPDRGKLRSITYSGIAQAMAQQWGTLF